MLAIEICIVEHAQMLSSLSSLFKTNWWKKLKRNHFDILVNLYRKNRTLSNCSQPNFFQAFIFEPRMKYAAKIFFRSLFNLVFLLCCFFNERFHFVGNLEFEVLLKFPTKKDLAQLFIVKTRWDMALQSYRNIGKFFFGSPSDVIFSKSDFPKLIFK